MAAVRTKVESVIHGIIRGLFVSDWAYRHSENGGWNEDGAGRMFDFKHWMAKVPTIAAPRKFHDDGFRLVGRIEERNLLPLGTILYRACQADGIVPFSAPDSYAEVFGNFLAWECSGRGVSWFDEHAKFNLSLPYTQLG
jgi:hypothetical protein